MRSGSADFYVRQFAIDVLFHRRVPAKDYLAEIHALFEWVQRHVRYTRDPVGIEALHSARRMLELRAGDCDDQTVLLGALLQSIGHPVRLVLIGRDTRRRNFSHIYLEVRFQGRWLPLDPTMPHPPGWSPPGVVTRGVVAVGTRQPPACTSQRPPHLGPAETRLPELLAPAPKVPPGAEGTAPSASQPPRKD